MITTGSLSKWMLASCGGIALSYNVLQVPDAPPLAEPPAFRVAPMTAFETRPDHAPLIAFKTSPIALEERTAHWLHSRDGTILDEREQDLFARMNARRGEPLMTQEEFLQVLNTPSAILPASRAARSGLSRTLYGQADEVIEFNRGKLETLFPGDEMYIYSQRLGTSLVMVVDQVEDHQDGSLTWRGHLKDMGQAYPVSFTQGPQFTLADILTPRGHFRLEAHGSQGRISQGPELPPDHFNMASHTAHVLPSLN